MKLLSFLLALLCFAQTLFAQKVVYTINADSTKLTGCDSNELIIGNHTQNVPGFLFNTGRGRTIFKRGVIKINDSLYLIGGDTLKSNAWLQGGNRFGATGILGTLDNNSIDLYTNNTQRLRLTNTGRLLIGTTTDNNRETIQLNGSLYTNGYISNFLAPSGTTSGALRLRWGTGDGAYIAFYKQANTDRRAFFATPADNRPFYIYDSVGVSFSTTPKIAIGNEQAFGNAKLSILKPYTQPTLDVFNAGRLLTDTTSNIDFQVKTNGDVMVGGGNDNGNKFQVNGSTYLNGQMRLTGTGGGTNGFMHTIFNPIVSSSTDVYGTSTGINFSPTMNINGESQGIYPVSITPTFNINGHSFNSDGIPPALLVASPLCGILIQQLQSTAGYSGQPLEIYQAGTSDKNAIQIFRNMNLTYQSFIWNNDNRPAASNSSIIPALRSTIINPLAGGGVSFTLDRKYYATEAAIDMHYETTPDGASNENTSISFNTTTNSIRVTPMYINGDKIGIGTVSPSAQLHTTGSVRFAGLTNDSTQIRVVVSDANGNLYYRSAASLAANDILRSSLAVNGTIHAEELKLSRNGWADYIFDSTYVLMPLKEVDGYIRAHRHLPGIPSAAEVARDGVSVGETQTALLKKIEELTLYNIQQEQKIDALNKKVEMLMEKIQSMQKKQ